MVKKELKKAIEKETFTFTLLDPSFSPEMFIRASDESQQLD